MPRVVFTPNLRRHVDCPTLEVEAGSVRQALDEVFARQPALRGYLLDEQGRLRRHVAVFVDSQIIADRRNLSDRVEADGEILVMQALSGG